MSFTLCTSGAIEMKAGAYASGAFLASGGLMEDAQSQAEGVVCAITRYDWIGNYANVPTNLKPILAEVTSNLVAIDVVTWDMAGYPTRIVAEYVINVRRDGALRGLSVLRDTKVQTFLGAT